MNLWLPIAYFSSCQFKANLVSVCLFIFLSMTIWRYKVFIVLFFSAKISQGSKSVRDDMWIPQYLLRPTLYKQRAEDVDKTSCCLPPF